MLSYKFYYNDLEIKGNWISLNTSIQGRAWIILVGCLDRVKLSDVAYGINNISYENSSYILQHIY